jgi:S1-C subfamily serine protease
LFAAFFARQAAHQIGGMVMKWIVFSALALGFLMLPLCPAFADDEEKGYIGVQIANSPDNTGVIIKMVLKDSPAHAAELLADDVITKMDGKEVANVQSFVMQVRLTKPGTKIKLTLTRNGQEKEIEVKVGKMSDS